MRHEPLDRSPGRADLTGADLPDELKGFEGLEGVAEASKYLQSLFKIILCSSPSRHSPSSRRPTNGSSCGSAPSGTSLPFIHAAVAPRPFGWIAPLLILTLFVYLVTYLAETWIQLSKLPAVFPDGTPLYRRAYPLSLNCLIRMYFMRLPETPPGYYEIGIAYLLIFGISLATLLFFWISYLKLHSPWISLWQVAWFSIAIQMTLYHSVLSIVVLGGKGWRDKVSDWPDGLLGPVLVSLNPWQFRLTSMHWDEKPKKPEENRIKRWKNRLDLLRTWVLSLWPGLICFMVLYALSFFFFSYHKSWPFSGLFRIDIDHKVVSQVVASDGHPIVSGADLEGMDLRNANAAGAYLQGADLKGVVFTGADLKGADFTGADLTGADISGCDLQEARITLAQIQSVKRPDSDNRPTLPVEMNSPWETTGTGRADRGTEDRDLPVVGVEAKFEAKFQLRRELERPADLGSDTAGAGRRSDTGVRRISAAR